MNKIKIIGKGFEELEAQANEFIQTEQVHVVSATPFNSVTLKEVTEKDENGKDVKAMVQVVEPILVLVHS